MLDDFSLDYEKKIESLLINNVGYEFFNPDTEAIKKYFNSLDLKADPPVITVGGTNGKGETIRTIGQYLINENKTFTCWTSPHVCSIRERFSFNSKLISYETLEELILKHLNILNSFELSLSFYEFLFALFVDWSKSCKPDYILLEVGLGGRLDAVNILDNEISVLTSISRDHTAILGNSYSSILQEKLGITRKNKTLISNIKLDYLNDKIQEYCRKNQVNWLKFTNNHNQEDLNFSIENRELAKFVVESLLEEPIEEIKEIDSLLCSQFEIKYCGAHNLDGLRKLIHLLEQAFYNNQSRQVFDILIFSLSNREVWEVEAMFKLLKMNKHYFGKIVVTHFEHFRAINLDVLKESSDSFNVEVEWKKIIEQAQRNHKRILVAGSYYFIGEVQKYILD